MLMAEGEQDRNRYKKYLFLGNCAFTIRCMCAKICKTAGAGEAGASGGRQKLESEAVVEASARGG